MPHSLTQELEDRKKREGKLTEAVEEVTGFAKTRALVLQRLGGEFDYSQYAEELRLIKVERDQQKRKFKTEQLWAPEMSSASDFAGKKAYYDFGVRPMPDSMEQRLQKTYENTAVAYERPDHLIAMRGEPQRFMSFDDFGPITDPLAGRAPTMAAARQLSPRDSHKASGRTSPAPPAEPVRPQLDILTLKKQVIEEVRAELEREAREKQERDERAHQALLIQR